MFPYCESSMLLYSVHICICSKEVSVVFGFPCPNRQRGNKALQIVKSIEAYYFYIVVL